MAFEAILQQQQAKPTRWRRVTLFVSLAVHVAALSAALVHSVWQVDEMPMPSLQVTLTAAVPPPPPPPPPAARKASSESRPKTRPLEPKPHELVIPKDTPKEQPKPEPAADSATDNAEPNGQVGGQLGGVPGGVVGGVVGAAPPPPPPPPPKPTGPKNVSASIGRGQLLIDPNSEPYRVKLPMVLARSGETYTAMLRLCVSAEGRVSSVQVLKGAGAALDGQFPSVMGRWRYRPLMVDGAPTPFCYLLRYEVSGR
ncbi:MAG TPA: energy transducer TonB [Polyangiaceae bacterium]|nr:energy transducer TonB [Polyangiaceae bacterium]